MGRRKRNGARTVEQRFRKEWTRVESQRVVDHVDTWILGVSDGALMAMVSNPDSIESEWHISVSFRDHKNRPSRYPRWDEVAHARETFIPEDIAMALIFPRADEFVSLEHTTFHLHQIERVA